MTVVLCWAIGVERETRGQVAGLRTHILVGLGAALFTLVSAYAFTSDDPANPVDPTRISAQIVTGIGFLGAGRLSPTSPVLLSRLRTDFVLLEIEMEEQAEFATVLEKLGRHGVRVEAMASAREEGLLGFRLEVEAPPASDLERAVEEIRRLPATRRVEARGGGSPSQAGQALDG